jgi:hypothetical protein
MNNDILGIIDLLGREKGIDKEILIEGLKSAMEAAARKGWKQINLFKLNLIKKQAKSKSFLKKLSSTKLSTLMKRF